MQEGLRRQGPRERVEMLKEQDHLMEFLQRIGLKYKTSLDLRIGFLIKYLPSSQRLVVIGSVTPKFKRGKGTNSPIKKPSCGKCGKKHYGDCLEGMDNCFSCGKSGHKMRDYSNMKSQDKGSGQAQASGSNEEPKKNCFYALRSRGE